MVGPKSSKQKMDRNADDDDRRRDKRSRRARSRSRSRSRSPAESRDKGSRRKRRYSKSRSPHMPSKQGKHNESQKEPEMKSEPPARKPKETDMLNTRTGGAYIPPARLRMMQAEITDKSSVAYQRLAWEALKKSIHGHINKINVGNIGIIIKELLKENIVRGRGLLCRSVIQAQAASPTFTNVYAALVSAVNSRFPNIGELLLKRLVIQFKRGFKRNDKAICISSASFIAHLVNQRVAHEILALELLTLLVETPTDDSVEVAIAFLKECGQKLTEVSSKGVNAIFEMLRNILHEGQLDKRVQYMIEVMFQVWKDGFKDHPALIEELELVPEEEQFTHLLMLDDATDSQDILNVFKFDEKYEENEQKYKNLSKEILGSDAESEEEGSGESGSEESEDEEEQDGEQKGVTIIDNTETNLVALRRTIYLTINSSLDFEECAHKLMKMQLKPGQEVELCHMFLDCCAEQRTYEKFYGLLAQRFCNINRIYIGPFEEIFKDSYATAHRLDTNRLRNVSKFFAHLLFTDSISWEVLECVKLNEEDTTSSSRIYIKILFQELAEYMGLKKLNDRLKDPTLQDAFGGVFPRDNPKNTRFSINFFTSIGLGGLTDELREHLKQMPKNVPPPAPINLGSSDSSSSSSSSSDSSSSDSSSSDSDEEEESSNKKNKKDKNKTKKNPKEKSPKPGDDSNKDTSKWGHDGFYDTYGKDARRTESRPERGRAWDAFNIQQRSDVSERRNREDDTRNRKDGNRDRNRENREESGRKREESGRSREEPTRNREELTRNKEESARSERRDKEKNYDNRDEQPRNDRRDRERNRADDNNEPSKGDGKEARNDRRDTERRSDKRVDKDRYDRKENDKGDRDDKERRDYDKGDKERNKKNDRDRYYDKSSDKSDDRRDKDRDYDRTRRNYKDDDDDNRYDKDRNYDKEDKEKNKKNDRDRYHDKSNERSDDRRDKDRDYDRTRRNDKDDDDNIYDKDKRENDKGDKDRNKKNDKDRYYDKSNDRNDDKRGKDRDYDRTRRNDKGDKQERSDRYEVSERYYGGTNNTDEYKNKRDKRSEIDSYDDRNDDRNKKYSERDDERKDKRRDQDRYAKDSSDEEIDSRKNKRKDKENESNDEYESRENDKPSRYWDLYGKKETIEKGPERTEGSKERRRER